MFAGVSAIAALRLMMNSFQINFSIKRMTSLLNFTQNQTRLLIAEEPVLCSGQVRVTTVHTVQKARHAVLCPTRLMLFSRAESKVALAVYPLLGSQVVSGCTDSITLKYWTGQEYRQKEIFVAEASKNLWLTKFQEAID